MKVRKCHKIDRTQRKKIVTKKEPTERARKQRQQSSNSYSEELQFDPLVR